MKFLIDANLPWKLSKFFKEKGFDSIHTSELEMGNGIGDFGIINICNREDRIVITKDDDFLKNFLIKKEPKKIIFITTGNISNKRLIQIFNLNFSELLSLIQSNSVIEISPTDITVHF